MATLSSAVMIERRESRIFNYIYISVVTLVCCAEMAELVEMPFGGRLTDVGPRNHVSDRVSSQIHSQLQGVTRQR